MRISRGSKSDPSIAGAETFSAPRPAERFKVLSRRDA